MALTSHIWSTYVLKIIINNNIIIKKNEIKDIYINAEILYPESGLICMCKDLFSPIKVFFSFVERTSRIYIRLLNDSNKDINLSNNPAIVNIFAIPLPNINIEPLPVTEINYYDENAVPHGECAVQVLMYGNVTRVRVMTEDIRWTRINADDEKRFLYSAEIWIPVDKVPKCHIHNSCHLETSSIPNIYISKVMACKSIVLLGIIYDTADETSKPPDDIYLHLQFTTQNNHIKLEYNQPTYMTPKDKYLNINSTQSRYMLIDKEIDLTYRNLYTSNKKYIGLFLPFPIHGITMPSLLWKEEQELNISVKGTQRTALKYGQPIGRMFFIPVQLGIKALGKKVKVNAVDSWQEECEIKVTTHDVNTQNLDIIPNPQFPSLYIQHKVNPQSDLSIELLHLGICIKKEHLVPICFKYKTNLNTHFCPTPLPETIVVLNGQFNTR
ncbi:virion transactivator/tegument [Murid herpesvirus 3]|uniref:Virion transactivator/tegument n=2 Tax=Murid betaherpesvirus 3 TaxID=2560603 RepID=A0A1P8VIW1_9BETA|nr:virion transactivator/tegument [Murine roseolovirus]APZ76284.1 virion transactivator/tegument [Murid betaherpesvirus 3]AYH64738.1 virion transactivator/tegument [Murid herpesvirus 3]